MDAASPIGWDDEPQVQIFLDKLRLMAHSKISMEPFRVLEFGSFSMHGHDPRPWFKNLRRLDSYTGVDWRAGPGVDEVALAHEFASDENLGAYKVVISVSALEHDPFWNQTIVAMLKCASPGGIVGITCAGPGWAPHELDCAPQFARVDKSVSVGPTSISLIDGFEWVRGYYENRTIEDILAIACCAGVPLARVEAQYAQTLNGLRTNVFIHRQLETK